MRRLLLRTCLMSALAWVLLLQGGGALAAEGRVLFRISLENTATHVQVRAVKRFAQELSERAGDSLDVRVHDSASLFRDRDVFSALGEGKVEMAVPGTWHVAKYAPDVNIFLLPVFYGRSAAENHAVLAGEVGRELGRRIEESLGVRIPGKWLDLGHANLFTLERKLTDLGQVKGLKIRVAGGLANEMRLEAAGADAATISWPDFPLWLDRGRVDGVLTTFETIRSAKLWEHGLKYAFEDNEYFPMYVPMVSARMWRLLSGEVRLAIVEAWERTAVWEREMAAEAQLQARAVLADHGMEIVIPDKAAVEAWRARLAGRQEAIISRVGLDKNLYEQAVRMLDD